MIRVGITQMHKDECVEEKHQMYTTRSRKKAGHTGYLLFLRAVTAAQTTERGILRMNAGEIVFDSQRRWKKGKNRTKPARMQEQQEKKEVTQQLYSGIRCSGSACSISSSSSRTS